MGFTTKGYSKQILIALLVFFVKSSNSQENAQTRIPHSLVECYQNVEFQERDNRLPMTMNMLIEIIRKAEDAPDYRNQDMRQLAISLLHRFRLDGIERAAGVLQSSNVIPFSPSGYQFFKHRILLNRLIPGNAINFPNNTLSVAERCALHFMLSSSIETQIRGDEAQRCNQLAQLRSHRVPRQSEFDDEENVDDSTTSTPSIDYEVDEETGQPRNLGEFEFTGVNINTMSQCPVENGVVRTPWGAVSAGPLIAGIAAGLEPQLVTTRDLLALSRLRLGTHSRQQAVLNVDNRWAATLSGDLAEVSLLQGPFSNTLTVGAPGAWNNTVIPRWYFLSQRERLQMTDAEIRGGLDGLILALRIVEWRNQVPDIRLSQLLDMYYSQRGVLRTTVRSCDRRSLFTQVAPMDTLQAQTTAFSTVLERDFPLRVTIDASAFESFSTSAAQALSTYIPQSLNDLTCAATSIVPNDNTIWRTATHLFIYVDTTWPFQNIQPVIAFLLENLDVNRFGSTYTILNAQDNAVIVNRANTVGEFYQQWNITNHVLHPMGFNLPNILRSVRSLSIELLEIERLNSSVGGQSKVALIIPNLSPVNEADTNSAVQQLAVIHEEVPDLRFLYLSGGTVGRFGRFVREESRDLFPLTVSIVGTGDNVAEIVNPVVRRIQQVPRRIINHRCGSNWQSDERGNNNMNQYVERNGVNFYRVHPNYFYHSGDNRRIRIQGHGYGTISVCTSRRIELPRSNSTAPNTEDLDCRQLISDSMDINLNNACDGHSLIRDCPPIFISVEGIFAEQITLRCSDAECRFPDNLRFGVHAENLGCFSTASRLKYFTPIMIFLLSVALRFMGF